MNFTKLKLNSFYAVFHYYKPKDNEIEDRFVFTTIVIRRS